ncbi:MAG: hypothetical protein GXP42_06200, partial [Chloroflexi bacterium]|nr:hypothetical protein [Chloroflexota bacterium]
PEKKGGAILLVTLNLNEDGSLLLEVADLGAAESVEYEGTWTVEDGDVVAEAIISKKETRTFRLSVDENGNLSVEGEDFVLTHIDETIPLHKQLPIPVDLSQRAYATVDIQAGNPLDPFIISVNGGGVLDGSGLGGDCVGYINIEPVVRIKWEGEADFARIFFYSDHDPTLIVQAPDGSFYCNDDANVLLLDPSLTFENPQEGVYNIWVGSYQADQLIPGVLVVTTREDVSVETFTLEGLVRRGPMPDVSRAPGGKAPDELVEAIRNLKKGVESLEAGEPFTKEVTVDGDAPAFEFDIEGQRCNGFIKAQPELAFDWSGEAGQLTIYFEGDDDTTLLVVAANGQITCNDDADAGNLNPMVTLDDPQEGRYAVFVGRVKPEVEVTGVLTVTDAADAQPQALAPKSFSLGSDNQ